MHINRIGPDITILADHLEVPGIGHLAVNAFVVHASEPVVIDTGLSLPDRGFLDALGSVIEPASVEWIWLTHPDHDHTGGLFDLLDVAPRARVVTTFQGVGIMSTYRSLPMDRVYLLNPGQTLDVGDRRLTGFRPPLFDNPATTGLYDERSGACFSSDCFGGPMPTAELATAPDAAELAPADLRAGQILWATIDSPWVHHVDPAKYAAALSSLRTIDPTMILSTHLPPAFSRTGEFLDTLALAPDADAFVGPDQAALDTMLAGAPRTSEPAALSTPMP